MRQNGGGQSTTLEHGVLGTESRTWDSSLSLYQLSDDTSNSGSRSDIKVTLTLYLLSPHQKPKGARKFHSSWRLGKVASTCRHPSLARRVQARRSSNGPNKLGGGAAAGSLKALVLFLSLFFG